MGKIRYSILLFLMFASINIASAPAQERGEEVTQAYRKALEINPNDLKARYLLGLHLLRGKSYKEAVSHLIVVYPSRADTTDMNYNIGLAYAGAGELQKAFQHYMKVAEINNVEAAEKYRLEVAFYNIGVAYQREGKLDDALQAYQASIRINPKQANAYCSMGEILYQKKDYDNSLENLKTCKNKDPERKGIDHYMAAVHLSRGIEQFNLKNYSEASIHLEKSIGLEPDNENAVYYISYISYKDKDYWSALRYLGKLKKVEGEEMKKALTSLLHGIGAVMGENGDWEGAITAFRTAVSINPEDPESRFHLGHSHMRASDFDRAIAELKEALRLDPKHQRAAINLAIALEKKASEK